MIKFKVETKSKSYPIYFGNGIVKSTGSLIKKNLPAVKKIYIVSDLKLPKIFLKKLTKSLKGYDFKVYKLSANERIKSLKVASRIIEQLLRYNFNRSDCLIALGGGIIGDLSAFVSNLTKRGLKFINIPTTLLAQVDASIGGKTAVNSNQGKNLIGTFYQPDFVISDVEFLKSLPQREIVSGYGEILKHSLILDKKFFFWLSKNGKEILFKKKINILESAIIKSCKIKAKIVKKDEKEKDLRMILNFGHTFAHGFEAAKKFSNELNHGEAVLLGMLIASDLSNKEKLLSDKELLQIKKHYKSLGLFTSIKKIFRKKNEINKIISFMKKDKKNTDKKISLILLNKIGKTKKVLLSDQKIKKTLDSYYN
jgi:3-dehydroquinate synthase|tara:strand:- start:386 stop:1486 length:1101 start_codon:yes stop_codon:yes gene_type:complete